MGLGGMELGGRGSLIFFFPIVFQSESLAGLEAVVNVIVLSGLARLRPPQGTEERSRSHSAGVSQLAFFQSRESLHILCLSFHIDG